MFRIFWQVWIGVIGKKDYQNAKRIKKTNSKRWNLWRILDFKCLYSFKKHFMIFQNSLIKSLIHKIKKIKISRIFWQLLLFKFLSIFDIFFFFLPVYGFQKNWKIFVLFYCMDPRFYQKIEIFEIPNFNKILSFTISFLIF